MTRVKRGIIHTKKRHNILSKTKGFKWGRKNLIRLASTATTKAELILILTAARKKGMPAPYGKFELVLLLKIIIYPILR